MEYTFRKATIADLGQIWSILEDAIARRKADGSEQWQDGYPNPSVIANDIALGHGFVMLEDDTIIGYTALLISNEPAYAAIEGKWLTDDEFVVFHRVAIDGKNLGRGLATHMLAFVEQYALKHGIYSIKADTNFDNQAMLRIFEREGYQYCGEVYFRGSARQAFEKVIAH